MRKFRYGDRCGICRHWFWESDGKWHSLVPIAWAEAPDSATIVTCPMCDTRPAGGSDADA